MNLYDTITQEELNRLIDLLLEKFHIQEIISLDDFSSEYCTLDLIWNIPDPLSPSTPTIPDNVGAGNEYIITDDFKIKFTNPKYEGIDYSIIFNYYDLSDGDLDDSHTYDVLKSKTVKLTEGWNTISFTEDIVYLQSDVILDIRKVD